MKKIFILAVALMTMLCACQESPESDIIDQKSGDTVQTAASSDGVDSIKNYDAPDSWQEDVTYDNSDIKLAIDAQIETPDVQKLSTYKIDESAGISQERVDFLIDEFFGDADVYDANKEMTKSEIEDMILRLKQQKAEAAVETDDGGAGGRMSIAIQGGGGDQPEVITDRSQIFDRMIESYEEMLTTAPETVEDKLLTASVDETGVDFVSFSGTGLVDGKGTYSVSYMASKKNNIAPTLSISNSEYRLNETEDSEEQNAENAPTREEAIALAEELVQKLGLTGMVISNVTFAEQVVSGDMFSGFNGSESTGSYGYIIEFSKQVDSIACIGSDNFRGGNISAGRGSFSGGMGGSVMSSGAVRTTMASVNRSMSNESLTIGVTKNGIEEISWNGYFEVSDVMTEDVALLSFKEIQELFRKNMELSYTTTETEGFDQFFTMNNISDTYNIYKAVLCYTKTTIKNDSDNSMLIPVWAFYSYQVDENGTSRYNNSPVMLINAIDGSVI